MTLRHSIADRVWTLPEIAGRLDQAAIQIDHYRLAGRNTPTRPELAAVVHLAAKRADGGKLREILRSLRVAHGTR